MKTTDDSEKRWSAEHSHDNSNSCCPPPETIEKLGQLVNEWQTERTKSFFGPGITTDGELTLVEYVQKYW